MYKAPLLFIADKSLKLVYNTTDFKLLHTYKFRINMRAPSYDMKTTLNKGSWSLEEDQKLISYINRYGIWNWSQMPRFAGLLRSGKSCRLRWMNYLKPNVKRGNFSKEEDEIILHSHSLLGNRWSAIASRLQGRTDNEIKNYWHTHLKKRENHNLLIEKTKSNDSNKFSTFEEDNDVKNIRQLDSESWPSISFEDESSSFNSCTSSIDQEVDFKVECYDIGSPGTFDDLECFWKQLCPIENLELGIKDQGLFHDSVFEDSFDDSISFYGF